MTTPTTELSNKPVSEPAIKSAHEPATKPASEPAIVTDAPTTESTKKPVVNLLSDSDVIKYGAMIMIESIPPRKKAIKSRLTGYNLYYSTCIAVLKGQINKDLNMMSIGGQLWRSLDAETKKSWSAEAKKQLANATK